jgi:hypothetical protein
VSLFSVLHNVVVSDFIWNHIALKNRCVPDCIYFNTVKADPCKKLQTTKPQHEICHIAVSHLKSTVFRDILIMLCSPLKVNWLALLGTCFMLVSCMAYSSTLKMEVTCSSETLVHVPLNTECHIPEDRTIHNHRCENLKSYNISLVCIFPFLWFN